jgi:hypothetical protein
VSVVTGCSEGPGAGCSDAAIRGATVVVEGAAEAAGACEDVDVGTVDDDCTVTDDVGTGVRGVVVGVGSTVEVGDGETTELGDGDGVVDCGTACGDGDAADDGDVTGVGDGPGVPDVSEPGLSEGEDGVDCDVPEDGFVTDGVVDSDGVVTDPGAS